jgi:hypothetical protein
MSEKSNKREDSIGAVTLEQHPPYTIHSVAKRGIGLEGELGEDYRWLYKYGIIASKYKR